jgi:3-oxoacyl-[acyl-carrier-protein] synthase II
MNSGTASESFICSTTGEIAILLGLQSRSITICSGSASASDAIGLGFEQVSSDAVDVAIVGGSEAPIIPAVIGSLCRAGVVSIRNDGAQQTPRAFTIDRDGFIVGEGAGFLILENEKHAKARKAKVYAELAGFGNSCDAYQMLAPHPKGEGVFLAADRAMKMSGILAKDVDYVNAHGTGTRLNDKYETIALKKIFGKNISDVRISSTKPITGHVLGACGAIEAIVCIDSAVKIECLTLQITLLLI